MPICIFLHIVNRPDSLVKSIRLFLYALIYEIISFPHRIMLAVSVSVAAKGCILLLHIHVTTE